jgi:hypothetical protein
VIMSTKNICWKKDIVMGKEKGAEGSEGGGEWSNGVEGEAEEWRENKANQSSQIK